MRGHLYFLAAAGAFLAFGIGHDHAGAATTDSAAISAPAAKAPPQAPPLSIYGQLPQFERAALSPSGERIAFIALIQEQRRLVVVDGNNKPVYNYPLGTTKIRGLYWAGEDRVMIETSNTAGLGLGFTADKAELFSMIVMPIDGSKIYSIFDGNEMIQGGIRGFHGMTEKAGKYYGYFGGITMNGDFRGKYLASTKPVLYEVDLKTNHANKLAPRIESPDDWRNWLVGAGGDVKAVIDYRSTSGHWFIRNQTNQHLADGVNLLGDVDLVGFGAQSATLIYSAEDEQGGETRWFEVPLEGGATKEILADKGIRSTFFDDFSRAMLGYEVAGDAPSYVFSDARQQKIINATLKAFPGKSVHLMNWNRTFDRLIVMTEGPNDPQNWYLVDIKTGRAEILGTGYPMDENAVGPMRMVHYKAGDGMEIAAVLTLPPGRDAKKLPVVILPHGGPASRDYPDFDWWAQALASRGYAVLQPNFRGSTGYGAAFENAGHGEWGRKMQTDLSDGLAWLAQEGIVDPKRACIVGASYGGYAALAGVTLQHGLYRCAAAVAGVSDVAKMAATDVSESGGNARVRRMLRSEIGFGKDLRAVSPINFAAQADAPILLVHGQDDTVVHYDQSSAMAAALRRADKPVEFVTLPGEDHWLSKSVTRLAMLEAVVGFVTKHNPPDTVH